MRPEVCLNPPPLGLLFHPHYYRLLCEPDDPLRSRSLLLTQEVCARVPPPEEDRVRRKVTAEGEPPDLPSLASVCR